MRQKSLNFEWNLEVLVQYLAWRKTGHNAEVIMSIYRLVNAVGAEDILHAFTETQNSSFVFFMQKLRGQYGWLTAREGVILFNILGIQNESGQIFNLLNHDYANNLYFGSTFPKIALYARAEPSVGNPTKDRLLVKTTKAAATKKWRENKRLSIQG